MHTITITDTLSAAVASAVREGRYDKVFLLSDSTTHQLCVPRLQGITAQEITIPAGDDHKTLSSAQHVWTELQRGGATRHSLLINIGGGMVTDLGGFCASCFKRGIAFINVPTTLLAMVDASLGGKTGINFGTLKNEIGVFRDPVSTIIDTQFLATLDAMNLRSGYAEMVKHGLLSTAEHLAALLTFSLDTLDYAAIATLIDSSIHVKAAIVEADPHEAGLRKALNLGHTIGHAIESLSLHRGTPLLHGYAVAYGLIAELYLCVVLRQFPQDTFRQVVHFLRDCYGAAPIVCDDYPTLLDYMTHDKKNTSNHINFTLLHAIGGIDINQTVPTDTIAAALDFLREG